MEEKEVKKNTKNKKENIDNKSKSSEQKKGIKKKIEKTEPLDKKEHQKVDEETKEVEIREVIVEKKSGFNYAEVVVIMVITLILGAVIGSFITYIISGHKVYIDGPSTSGVPAELKEFISTYDNIITDYYEEIDHDKLLEAGISGMLEYLGDEYSFYMNPEASETFNEQVEGKYRGIGVEITLKPDTGAEITRVFENTPAAKAGLQVGDVFLKVNGEEVTTLSTSEIAEKIKGSIGDVTITVKRLEEELEYTLNTSNVDIESINSKMFNIGDKKIGYLDISIFASNSYPQFEKKLLELEGENIDSLIIDVRDNSGGYLTTVTDIASLFMKKDKIIYQLDTKGIVEQVYSKTNTSRNYNIIVLVNKNSASASEILAAALQESYGAKIVGTNSFGKGTVQKAYQLESGATVKYTIQKWLTPNGNWIHEKGVTPDIEEVMELDYYQNPSDETDNQLQRALEELGK